MLVLGSQLINTPVMSLQTGVKLAVTNRALIDPANLFILAYELEGPLLSERPSYLRMADVRELSSVGLIVNDSDEFVGKDDIIKLREIDDLRFDLINMRVIDETKRRIGRIRDYTVDTDSFSVQQLQVSGGVFQRFIETSKTIHRSQIVEINNTTIVVKTTAKKVEPARAPLTQQYTNPFRSRGNEPTA